MTRVVEGKPSVTKVTRVIEGKPSVTKVTRVIEGQPSITKVTRVIEGEPTLTKVTRVVSGKLSYLILSKYSSVQSLQELRDAFDSRPSILSQHWYHKHRPGR